MMDTDYQIKQLAEKAGVSIRTIRYYIDEGLLPTPGVRGRYAVYGDEYLDRIELIRLLKARFMPLKEIRARMSALRAEDVRELLKHERQMANEMEADEMYAAPPPAPASQPEKPVRESTDALDYINRVLKRESRSEILFQKVQSRPEHSPLNPLTGRMDSHHRDTQEVWERIWLAPGVELHIQRPVDTDIESKLERLIELANQLFNS